MTGTLPFVRGSATSKAAALAKEPTAASDGERVLLYIRGCGEDGATDDEIETALGFSHQNASARRNGLAKLGAIERVGLRRLTRSGCAAEVWRAVDGDPKPPPAKPQAPTRKQRQKTAALMRKLIAAAPHVFDDDVHKVVSWLER